MNALRLFCVIFSQMYNCIYNLRRQLSPTNYSPHRPVQKLRSLPRNSRRPLGHSFLHDQRRLRAMQDSACQTDAAGMWKGRVASGVQMSEQCRAGKAFKHATSKRPYLKMSAGALEKSGDCLLALFFAIGDGVAKHAASANLDGRLPRVRAKEISVPQRVHAAAILLLVKPVRVEKRHSNAGCSRST